MRMLTKETVSNTAMYLWVHVVDTTNTHNKGQLGLILNVEPTLLLGLTLEADEVLLLQSKAGISVLLGRAVVVVAACESCRWCAANTAAGSTQRL